MKRIVRIGLIIISFLFLIASYIERKKALKITSEFEGIRGSIKKLELNNRDQLKIVTDSLSELKLKLNKTKSNK